MAWEITATDTALTGPGVLQVGWNRPSNGSSAQEVFLDDLVLTS